MASTIPVAEIKPGDVLLFHGDSFVSWAIRRIDGSEVNHAAVALGNGVLAEAGGGGLTSREIGSEFSDKNYMLVRRLANGAPSQPVLDKANAYLANRNFYAYQQIVLLAILGLTRRLPSHGFTKRLIRSVCDHAADDGDQHEHRAKADDPAAPELRHVVQVEVQSVKEVTTTRLALTAGRMGHDAWVMGVELQGRNPPGWRPLMP